MRARGHTYDDDGAEERGQVARDQWHIWYERLSVRLVTLLSSTRSEGQASQSGEQPSKEVMMNVGLLGRRLLYIIVFWAHWSAPSSINSTYIYST